MESDLNKSSSKTKKELGQKGEDIAAQFLSQHGYTILKRNYRHQHAEIDFIVQKGGFLIFVEVKYRTSLRYGYPEEAGSERKQTLYTEAAEAYMIQHDWKGPLRFDVIAITKQKKTLKIAHFEDAFY